jgi:Rrf2 family protein
MITRTGLHAVRAMVLLARLPAGACAGAVGIAQEIGAPPNYLSKLLRGLARAGLVRSQKGLGGGFRLVRDPGRISLLDVVEPIERVSRWSGCLLGHRDCSYEVPCAIHRRWTQVRTTYLRLLTQTTLADLLAKGELLIPRNQITACD